MIIYFMIFFMFLCNNVLCLPMHQNALNYNIFLVSVIIFISYMKKKIIFIFNLVYIKFLVRIVSSVRIINYVIRLAEIFLLII